MNSSLDCVLSLFCIILLCISLLSTNNSETSAVDTTLRYSKSGVTVMYSGANSAHAIVTDHLGTPIRMYDRLGRKSGTLDFTVYGKEWGAGFRGWMGCPFRYPGQYADAETGLYYNRFRYYDPEAGQYVSQDPIGLQGGNPTLYGYVGDVNRELDVFGLSCRNVDSIAGKHGGKKIGDHRYQFEGPGAKRRAKQASSEIAGDLGSNPTIVRRKDYTDPMNTFHAKNSNRVIGKHSSATDANGKPLAGYHDHEIGHSRFNAPPHFNAWSESTGTGYTSNAHLFY